MRCFSSSSRKALQSSVSVSCGAWLWRRSFNSSSASLSRLETAGPFASRLKSRGVLRFHGPDTFRFLQGLVTNDVSRLAQDPPPPSSSLPTPNRPVGQPQALYTALLNPQGRFLFDIFLYRPLGPSEQLDKQESSVLLGDVDATALDELLNHLKKYKLRAKVDFEDISKDLSVWQRYGGSLVHGSIDNGDTEVQNVGWGAASDPAAQASIEGNNKGYHWLKDPRLGSLGFRGIFPSDSIPPLVEADKEVDEVYYLLYRLERGVPEGCSEIPKEKANPLEYNLAWLNSISFEKGCYVGQELVARTHHRGVIRKRLMPIIFVNESGGEVQQAVMPGAEIIDTTTQKKIGDVTAVLGSRGFGVIRLEAAQKEPPYLIVKGLDGIHVKVYRPKWWPADWCPEELQPAANA